MVTAKFRLNGKTCYDTFESVIVPDEAKDGLYEVKLVAGFTAHDLYVNVKEKNIDAFLDDLENCIETNSIFYLVDDDVYGDIFYD